MEALTLNQVHCDATIAFPLLVAETFRSKSETSPLMKVKDEFTVKFILIVLCLRILMDQFAIGVQFDYHFRQFLTIQK